MRQESDGPQISVITPFNGSITIGACVRSLARQSLDAKKYELLIGCESGAEPDPAIMRGLPFAVKMVQAPNRASMELHSAGRLRNSAIRQARGMRLVFIDSDCIAAPTCLEQHSFADMETALCGTKLEVVHSGAGSGDEVGLFERLSAGAPRDERLTHEPIPGRGGCWGFWTCNASAPAELVMAAGLFDEEGFRCHDIDLAYRLQLRGARFRLDPECQVVHVEHGRSIWLTRARIAGLRWLVKKHPDAEAGTDNLLAIFRNLFHNNLLEAEGNFARVTSSLPGVRAGLGWVTPPGYSLAHVLTSLAGLQTIVRRNEHGVQIFLRLAEQCWDYSIIVPDSRVVEQPLFSVIVLPSNDEAGIARTVESLLSQTCQSFEIILAATPDTAGYLRTALNFTSSGRVRTHFVPPQTSRIGTVESVWPLCRGYYLVQVEPGGWLREGLLSEVAKDLPQSHQVGSETCRSGCDWSFAGFDQDTQHMGDQGGVAGNIHIYPISHLQTAVDLPKAFVPPRQIDAGRLNVASAQLQSGAGRKLAYVAPNVIVGTAGLQGTHVLASDSSLWQGEDGPPIICGFTFDSGPHPTATQRVLDALDETETKGTFFLVGTQIRRAPEVVRRIVTSGHEIGLQGYDYEDLSRCDYSTIFASIDKTLALISDLVGATPRWFRPPLARCSALVREVCRRRALRPVGWHVSSEDWTGQHHYRSVSTVLAYGLKDAVVLFHDACGDPWETALAVSALGHVARANGTAATLSALELQIPLPFL